MACDARSSLRRADARASGSPETSAPVRSAWYSREREIASCIKSAAMGARFAFTVTLAVDVARAVETTVDCARPFGVTLIATPV